jgi:hypothetical protein
MIPSNLIPGAVWQRQRKKDATLSTVLFVTNIGLSEAVLERNPQQVVFRTEQGKVLSMSVEDFTANRSFAVLDSVLAAHIAQIDSYFEEEDEEVTDLIGGTQIEETLFAPELAPLPVIETVSTTVLERKAPASLPGLSINVGPHPLATALQSSLVAYTEAPYHNGDTLHTLKFLMQPNGLTLADVRSAFSVKDPNSIQKFELTTTVEKFQVEIVGFLDVMLESNQLDSMACLYVLSEGDFRAPAEDPVAETAVIDLNAGATATASVIVS